MQSRYAVSQLCRVGAVPAALCPASSAADAWVVRATPSMHRVGRTRRGGVRCGFEPRFVECRTAWDRVCQRCSAVLAARRAVCCDRQSQEWMGGALWPHIFGFT